jgi:ribosome biogenesis GTPase / thiamine phosphate phosphatase
VRNGLRRILTEATLRPALRPSCSVTQTPTLFDAQVIAAFGRHCIVKTPEGAELEARPRGRKLDIVAGDRVRCEPDPAHGSTSIVEVLPRTSLLTRSNARGGSESVIANLTQLIVVIAAQPKPDLFILDRYLCAATDSGLKPLVVANKSDLSTPVLDEADAAALAVAGYRTLRCTARDPASLAELRAALAGEASAFVGQSGVGKSSLVKALIPSTSVATQELSREDEGKHTTTAARIYELESAGQLIDSPGVRDYSPAIDRLDRAALGFPEIARLAPQCRFRDCGHLAEPQCAVRGAVERGEFDARRYESYRRLRRLFTELTHAQHPSLR